MELLKKGLLKLVRIKVSRPINLEIVGLNRFIEPIIKFIVSVLREDY
jgi:EamA domain-containing membrane protein RarD